MDPLSYMFFYFLICVEAAPEGIPLMNSVVKGNKDTQRLKQSLKILREYLEELGVKQPQQTKPTYHISKVEIHVKQPQEIQTTHHTSKEVIFGPRYPTMDVKEPPMEIPLTGLRDDNEDIPRNLFFQPIPRKVYPAIMTVLPHKTMTVSDKANTNEKFSRVHQKKEIKENMLLPICIITLLVLLILLAFFAIGIYECTKENRAQDQCEHRSTQTEEFKLMSFSAVMTIVDEVSSYSDESQATQDRNETKPPHGPKKQAEPS